MANIEVLVDKINNNTPTPTSNNILITNDLPPTHISEIEASTVNNNAISNNEGNHQAATQTTNNLTLKQSTAKKIKKRLSQNRKKETEFTPEDANIPIPNSFWAKAHVVKKEACSYKNFAALLMVKLFDHQDLIR